MAIGILSAFNVDELKKAIATEDIDLLSSISGIGDKTAQRLVLELKEKMALPDLKAVGENTLTSDSPVKQVREALRSLGYSPIEISKAMEKVGYEVNDWEEYLREALKVLGG